jgi:epoxyqueuosine reductase
MEILQLEGDMENPTSKPFLQIDYQYRSVPVSRLPYLQEDIDSLKRSGRLSTHPVYQDYLKDLSFTLPKDFPDARSLIILASFTPPMLANFRLDGISHEVIIPSGYYSTGLKIAEICRQLLTKVTGNPNIRLEKAENVHMKLLAVRSGLGRYGRNNICFVGEMGSFITLSAFFTSHGFETNDWEEIRYLDQCQNCQVCRKNCPTGAIRTDSPVIDVGHCLTLYNEVAGEFPAWIQPNSHNALIGCMKCQWLCPANQKALQRIGRFDDVTEEETREFLSDVPDEAILKSLCEKLHLPHVPGSKEIQTIFTRNLRVLLKQHAN